jgi:hypothetical protein
MLHPVTVTVNFVKIASNMVIWIIIKLIPKLSVFGHKSNNVLRSSVSAATLPIL